MTETLPDLYREADRLTGRIMEARLDIDRAYDRMLAEQDAARKRAADLEARLHDVAEAIRLAREAVR